MSRSARPAITTALLRGDPARCEGPEPGPVTSVGIPVLQGEDGPTVAPGLPVTVEIGGAEFPTSPDVEQAARRGFTGAVGQSLAVWPAGVAAGTGGGVAVVFVGCGPARSLGTDVLRRAAAAFVRAAGRSGTGLVVVPGELAERAAGNVADEGVSPEAMRRAAQVLAEGAVLAAYRFDAFKAPDPAAGGLERVVLGATGDVDAEAWAEGARRGAAVAAAVCFARDLVNEPPSSLTPTRLAEIAAAELPGPQVTVEIWDERRIADERLGGLMAVARGSVEPPRLVRASYRPEGADPGSVPHVVLVGKGITFDSGGLSLKTGAGMMTMKTDMSGAAAVLAAVSACAELGIGVAVTAIAPVTENMPGGRAQKPGDVLTVRNGKTIEVLNTDAEGRLVLADGLVLASELEPDMIVDLATLTGACVVALGNRIAGLFGNDEGLVARVRAAAARAGEPAWPMPLAAEYEPHIESEIADMKNIGKDGQAGAIAAALLLVRFVGDVPWAHLDIAGPARSEEEAGIFAKGGTGVGVRTLLELLGSAGDVMPTAAAS